MISRRRLLQTSALIGGASGAAQQDPGIEVLLQTRDPQGRPSSAAKRIDPAKTAVFLIDAWHYHWCRTWRNRAGSLVPRINHSLDGARKLGMTLVFSPTNAMRDLNESQQRKNTLALADQVLPKLTDLHDPYPGAIRWGMCECGLGDDCHYTNNVNNQHPEIRMTPAEYIALTQQEAYNVLKKHGIEHIIYTGFATNMCMWGKPTGMKFMRQFGFDCMVARDLTEAITRYAEESFNPTRGTLEVIELIERDLGPTLSMEKTLRNAGAWEGEPVLDYVHIAPWGRFFGGPVYPIPIQAELTCRHKPGAELRYTLDGSDPSSRSPVYKAPIRIDRTLTMKAAGFQGARQVTRVSVADYWKFPPVPQPPDVFISDLEPVSQWTGEAKPRSYAVKKAARFNRSVDGAILSSRDYKFFKGIGVQAPSRIAFQVKPEYRRFVALVGVDDECMRWDNPGGLKQWPQWSRPINGTTSYRLSQIVFQVAFDGKPAATTPALFNGDKSWGIDVPVPPGVKLVELRVDDVDSRITDPHGHGDWLNAGFVT
ncbi:MAG: NPCBM/NEW2 domain-containing protein [Bryobacteraceae bacterium]